MKQSKLLFASSFLSFILLNGVGCAFKKADKKDAKQSTTAEEVVTEIERVKQEALKKQTIKLEDFDFEVHEGKTANQYSVSIHYPTIEGLVVYIALESNIPNLHSGIVLDAEGGKKLKFTITAYNSAGVLVLNATKLIEVPLDIVVSGLYPLQKDLNLKIGRLYLNEDSVLKTNGYLLSIEANQILVGRNSRILNFDQNDIWTSSAQQSGGSISIRAKKASGYLIINLQGAKGKNGRSGTEIEHTRGLSSARNGFDGDPGEWDGDEDCTEDRFSGQQRCGVINIRCTNQPSNGEDGENGANGQDGEAGVRGGDSGSLFVQIKDDSYFTLNVSVMPGTGGLGGAGAPGKPGGKGGAPGTLDQQKVCKPAQKGKDGQSGKPGRDGENGSPGNLGTIELNGLKNSIIQ
ncbi:hypothetical protein [Bdellovibrio bacteriovorus]|uniref:Uncharacterized protein n=1 Tax=Bdellovibrio bacteriovorus str. Tiberius TaxID=1069642 RepID=K7YQH2_BDEBC|nr:hypothetical protein [Bdellovibrio bacteriovorus]AFX99792.1 hypothetical protein Bdt_0080 [Bdellovibrio bacteriovorus str. Tiberius]